MRLSFNHHAVTSLLLSLVAVGCGELVVVLVDIFALALSFFWVTVRSE